MIFSQKYFAKMTSYWLLGLVLFCVSFHVVALQAADFSNLPANAKSPQDFIPKGWYLENKIETQLNGDKFKDAIIVLIDRTKAAKDTAEGNRTLVVLLGKPLGGFALNSVAQHILWCEECYGSLGGPGGNFPEIKVSKGIISIYQSGGSVQAVDITLKFRYETKCNKFRLIGKDSIIADRPSGNFETVSINYLTSQKKVGNVSFDRFGNNEKIRDRTEKIKPTSLYLETYNIEDL